VYTPKTAVDGRTAPQNLRRNEITMKKKTLTVICGRITGDQRDDEQDDGSDQRRLGAVHFFSLHRERSSDYDDERKDERKKNPTTNNACPSSLRSGGVRQQLAENETITINGQTKSKKKKKTNRR